MSLIPDSFAVSNLEYAHESHSVVISRFWDNPEITISINRNRIEVMLSMDDFVKALLKEIDWGIEIDDRGWRKWVMPYIRLSTKEKMERKLRKAIKTTIEKVKEATK